MPREGLPTVRIRTLDHAGNPTGEVILDPDAARLVPGNVEVALEGLGTVIDATGGVSHGGLARFIGDIATGLIVAPLVGIVALVAKARGR